MAGKGYVTHLLRRSYREGGKVERDGRQRLAPVRGGLVELIRRYLLGERFLSVAESFEVEQSFPHGHVEVALQMADGSSCRGCSDRKPSRERQLVLAMLVEWMLGPLRPPPQPRTPDRTGGSCAPGGAGGEPAGRPL